MNIGGMWKKIAPEVANYIKMLSVVIFVSAPLLWLSDMILNSVTKLKTPRPLGY